MAHRVTLRRDAFEARANELGLESQSAQARAIGVVTSIHNRALKGTRALSAEYALGVLRLVGSPELRREIDALFDIPANTTTPARVAS